MEDHGPAPRRQWLSVVVVVLVLVVGVGAIGALLSGEEPDDLSNPPTTDAVSPPTTTPADPTTSDTGGITTTIGFETFTIAGSGDDTVALQAPGDLATVLHITHDGEAGFSVTTLDSDSEPIEVLVDSEGAYEGSRAINLILGDVISAITIVADGDWVITATYLGNLERSDNQASGSGDGVVLMDITNPAMTVTHDGEGDFAVFMWTFESQGYVIQESGSVDTTVSVPMGGVVIEIVADGNWELSTTG